MLSLYEILKASKTGIAPDMWTALTGKNWGGADSGAEVKELTGIPPLSFTADGTSLLDYLISGNMTQTGTPTPTTPIQPQECGERTAQLIPYPFYSSDGEYAGVQFTTDNGRVIANGTLTSGLLYYLWRPAKFPAGTYTMSVKGKHSGATIYFRDTTHNVSVASIYGTQGGDRSVTFTVTEEISAMVYINASYGTLDFDCTIMLNTGEEALPFEPTYGYKIPISSANTTTPVYLGEVESTRRIKKLVLTGEETVAGSAVTGGWIITNLSDSINNTTGLQTSYCSHYVAKNNGAMSSLSQGEMCINTQVNNRINFVTTFASSADFKAYLAAQYAAGTPVCVWYVLATETTGIVNEPLRKIGDYADTLSMEQAGVQIPTNRGNTVVDVLTELKPSEMYIKYQE